MLWVKHLLRYLLIPYTDVGWSRTPLHSCKSTNQMFKVKQKQNTSAIGPNVLKIFSFTESCNSCSAFATMPFKSNSLWCANEEHSPTNSRCRHSPRLPGVESTLEHLTRFIWCSPGCSLFQGQQAPRWCFLPPMPENKNCQRYLPTFSHLISRL